MLLLISQSALTRRLYGYNHFKARFVNTMCVYMWVWIWWSSLCDVFFFSSFGCTQPKFFPGLLIAMREALKNKQWWRSQNIAPIDKNICITVSTRVCIEFDCVYLCSWNERGWLGFYVEAYVPTLFYDLYRFWASATNRPARRFELLPRLYRAVY